MTMRTGFSQEGRVFDVCIVGAGPIGIAAALECEQLGLEVLLLESGGNGPEGSAAQEVYGTVLDLGRHAPLDIAVCRALGGSSWWWGGRCLPMDPVDYQPRPFVAEGDWPIGPADVAAHEERAAQILDCGTARFHDPHPAWSKLDGGVQVGALERWARTREAARVHGEHLQASALIEVCLETAVQRIVTTGGTVDHLVVSHAGREAKIEAKTYILAAGGLGTTSLLLQHQRQHPAAFGGEAGALGRYYMGHTHGKIADIVFSDPALAETVDFYLDDTGTWVRRRLTIDADTQIANEILNTAFWVDNAAFHDWRHGSGILSAVYLALCIPPLGRRLVAEGIRRMHVGPGGNYLRHLANVLLHPFATAASAWRILMQRYVRKPRQPGFLIRNRSGRYALTFHGEQLPRRDSKVELGSDGRLSIDLRFSEADARSIVRAHELVDASLREAGLGYLDYHVPAGERVAAVLAQAQDGYHQQGLLRMGSDPATSVVDRNSRVHDFGNLYIASTGILPTSGQANPTFTACALAVRLAHHLAAEGGARAAA